MSLPGFRSYASNIQLLPKSDQKVNALHVFTRGGGQWKAFLCMYISVENMLFSAEMQMH